MANKSRLEKEMSEAGQQLWESFTEGRGLRHLVDTAYFALGNPIIITDGSSPIISSGIISSASVEKSSRRYLEQSSSANGLCLVVTNKSVVFIQPEKAHDENIKYGYIVAKAYFQNTMVGKILVLGSNREITKEDCEFVSNFSRIIAAVLATNEFIQANKGVPNAELFRCLLDGEVTGSGVIDEQLKKLDVKIGDGLAILIVDHRAQSIDKARELREACSIMLNCSMCALYKGYVVLLYHIRNKFPLSEHHFFLTYLKDRNYQCGMSHSFFDFSNISLYYSQAKASAEIGARFWPDETLHKYERCLIYHNIQLASERIRLSEMLHPMLNKLIAYDSDKETSLAESLRLYIKYVNNQNMAAEALHIHRNTLFYRIKKIEEITGWNLSDGEVLSEISYFFKVLDML